MNQPGVPFLRRVAIIGDVHGEDKALEAVLLYLQKERGLDAILCTGDLPGKQGIGNTDRCRELIQEAGVLMIKGNHDAWAVENEDTRRLLGLGGEWPLNKATIAFLKSTPRTRTFETSIGSLLLCHGVGNDYMAGIYPFTKADQVIEGLKEQRIYGWHRIMVAGHAHMRLAQSAGTVAVINPGTLRYDEQPGFAIADFENGTVQFYNLTPFTNEITEAETRTPWTSTLNT
jgi:putative phosphoesterase